MPLLLVPLQAVITLAYLRRLLPQMRRKLVLAFLSATSATFPQLFVPLQALITPAYSVFGRHPSGFAQDKVDGTVAVKHKVGGAKIL